MRSQTGLGPDLDDLDVPFAGADDPAEDAAERLDSSQDGRTGTGRQLGHDGRGILRADDEVIEPKLHFRRP